MGFAQRPLLLLLLLFVLKEAKAQQESRPRRQFGGDTNPAFGKDLQPASLPFSITPKECQEQPEIPHARVRCGYSGCRVMCDKDYRTGTGLTGYTTLSCDHSSGTLTLDGTPWREKNVTCLPFCGVDGCLNGGNCVEPRICECPLGFSGQNCEITPENYTEPVSGPQADPNACPDPDFPVQNAQVTRQGQSLMVRCNEGHVFKIGRTIAFIQCRNGAWDHPEGVFAPGGALVCEETQCDPPCLNGGKCLPEGICDCPYKFWGGYCQIRRCGYPDPATLGPASLGGVPSRMKIQCHPRHRMLNGHRTQTILCRDGDWYLSGLGYLKDNDVKCYPEDRMPVRPPL